jgi:hypothetical protein
MKYVTWLFTAVLLLSACTAPVAANIPAGPAATPAASSVELASVEPTPTAAAATSAAAVASEATVALPDTDRTDVDLDGSTVVDPAALSAARATGELDAAEIEGILYMREEEKLARDVYLALYEKWGIPIFQNIADSEATHMQAVKTLIDRYDLPDPAAGNDVGVFADQALQGLYDQLLAQGSGSLADALRVGAAIEEIDILDLERYLAQTDQADIQQVYQNLAKGSRNHLRAFVTNLGTQAGETYVPLYLSQAAYDDIVNAAVERGRND